MHFGKYVIELTYFPKIDINKMITNWFHQRISSKNMEIEF